MSGNIIAITQQKGGAGKTTLAAILATGAAEAGQSVLCLDIDPQGSLTMWRQLRQEQSPTLLVTVEAAAGHRVCDVAELARRDYDLVLIDAPPHAETETRQAIRSATLVLTPMQPSPLDLWATKSVIEAAQAAGRPVRLVLNRILPAQN
jgi:chromosome partitioning protein